MGERPNLSNFICASLYMSQCGFFDEPDSDSKLIPYATACFMLAAQMNDDHYHKPSVFARYAQISTEELLQCTFAVLKKMKWRTYIPEADFSIAARDLGVKPDMFKDYAQSGV